MKEENFHSLYASWCDFAFKQTEHTYTFLLCKEMGGSFTLQKDDRTVNTYSSFKNAFKRLKKYKGAM